MTDAAAGGMAHNAMIRVEENGVKVTPVAQMADERSLRIVEALDRLDIDTIDQRAAIFVLWLRAVGSGDSSGLPDELNQLANAMALQRVGQVVAGYSQGTIPSEDGGRGWADFFIKKADEILDDDMAELKARMDSKGGS